MRPVQWSDVHKIGHEKIDSQHRKLVGLVAELQHAIGTENESETASNTLKALVDYTQYHFQDEEALMASIGFSELERHKYQHRQLLEQVVEILTELRCGKPLEAEKLVDFLMDWLTDHILSEDTKIGVAIRARQRISTPA
jgi:hemerythrin